MWAMETADYSRSWIHIYSLLFSARLTLRPCIRMNQRLVYTDKCIDISQAEQPKNKKNVLKDAILLLMILPFVVPVAVVTILWRLLSYKIGNIFKFLIQTPVCKPGHASITQSATAIARKIKNGEYSSLEVVRASIDHIKAVNCYVNAVCNIRFDEAIIEAKECDQKLASLRSSTDSVTLINKLFEERPYFGVPCSVKECFGLAGIPSQSSGFTHRKGKKPFVDATTVGRMRSAGLIPVCNTNTSEGCMWYESSNALFGRSNNAYDQRRIVGGSSGGEACLIATAAVPCGIGSDIGGSIRMPAAMNGIFGHKPTGGLVPATGQFPETPYPFLVTGPFALRSEDLLPLLKLMAGPDGVDRACTINLTDLRPVSLPTQIESIHKPIQGDKSLLSKRAEKISSWSDVTVHYVPWEQLDVDRPPTSTLVEASMRAAVDKVVSVMVNQFGCKGPVAFPFPEFREAFDIWGAVLADAPDNPKFADVMREGHGRKDKSGSKFWFAIEALKWCFGASDCTLPAIGLSLLEDIPSHLMPQRHEQLVQKAVSLKKRINMILSETNGVLIFPPFPTVAPIHDTPLYRILDCSYTAIFNVLEVPITVAPINLSAEGMPVCVQIVSGRCMDKLTIAVAEALEATGAAGWTRPPLIGTD